MLRMEKFLASRGVKYPAAPDVKSDKKEKKKNLFFTPSSLAGDGVKLFY
jgi:hypothetical protein